MELVFFSKTSNNVVFQTKNNLPCSGIKVLVVRGNTVAEGGSERPREGK